MRIISGNNRGTVLKTPRGDKTRPTLGRVRESIFSILGPYFSNQVVMDLFAGSGALGFEALSRHAERCYFVENNSDALLCLRDNAVKLRFNKETAVLINKDVFCFLSGAFQDKIDVVLLDPPYNLGLADQSLHLLSQCNWLAEDAYVMCQCGTTEVLQPAYGWLVCEMKRRYGETIIYLFRLAKSL